MKMDNAQQTGGFFAKPQDGIELVIKTVIMFVISSLLVIGYFALFSVITGSSVSEYVNQGDFVNMTSLAVVLTIFCVSFFWLNTRKKRMLLLAFGLLIVLMILVVSINRYLAVYPESGAAAWFFYVGLLDLFVVVTLPVGLSHAVQQIIESKYD